MQIKTIEHSPFPKLESIKTTNLVLTQAERKALVKAVEILDRAEDMVFNHLWEIYNPDQDKGTFGLSDLDNGLSNYFTSRYYVEELLEDSWKDGLRLD